MNGKEPTGIQIGKHWISPPVALAPMAGVTDRPFRQLCRTLGAPYTVGEMLTSDVRLWQSRKSRQRRVNHSDPEPRAVQIAGADPAQMAEAARACEAQGVQILDINLGCPAKKVCNKAAGSALMREPELVHQILRAVLGAVSIPVTLKMRTGWCKQTRNAVDIGRMAEDCGIQLLTLHGRSRACRYHGAVEYDTIARLKQAVHIPVLANGDISTPDEARKIVERTGADGVMIGRAALGRPWMLRQVGAALRGETPVPDPDRQEIVHILLRHVQSIHRHYGEHTGIRMARKHVGWYLQNWPDGVIFRQPFNRLESGAGQLAMIRQFAESHSPQMESKHPEDQVA